MIAKDIVDNENYLEGLFNKRIILINKEINEESTTEWIGRITLLDLKIGKPKKPIILMINSYGGNPYCALGMANIIQNTLCPVTTVCIGAAMSAASILLFSGKNRYAVIGSKMMIHQHSEEDMGTKSHTQLINEAEESKKLNLQMEDFYAQVSGQPNTKIKKMLLQDSYMTPHEALDLGFIDGVGWDIHNWLK